MSPTFSLTRLGKLIAKQFFENSRFYFFSVLALFGLLALVFAFWIVADGGSYREEVAYIIFFLGLFIAGSVFASMSFNMLGNKDKGVTWLGVPATTLEKLICTIFYTTVVFTIAYCLCFFIVKSVSIAYIKTLPGSSFIEIKDYQHGFGKAIKYFVYTFFATQALYLLGSVYFSRYSFVITTVAGAVVIFAFGYYITRIQNDMLWNNAWDIISVMQRKPGMKDGYLLYSVSPTVSAIFLYIVQFAGAPLFWVITWFRLKEKEL